MLRISLLTIGVFVTQPAFGETKMWTGGAATTSWHDADNWDPVGAPATGDDVIIDIPGSVIPVVYSTGTTALNSLACEEDLDITGGTFNLATASQINGVLTISAGSLGGSGDLTISNTLNWNGGTMASGGKTILAMGSTLTIDGTGMIKTLSRILEVHGNATYATDNLRFTSGTLTVAITGILDVSGSGGFTSSGGTNLFSNAGIFTKSGSASFVSNVPLANTGTISVLQGTLQFSGGGSNSNSFSVASGAALTLSATLTHGGASSLGGMGTITFAGGTHSLPNGVFSPRGPVNFNSGTITVNNEISPTVLGNLSGTVTFNATLNYSGAITLVSGTTNFNTAQVFPILTITSGTLAGSGEVTIQNTLNWNGGTMSGTGKTIMAEGSALTIGAVGVNKTLSRVLENYGTTTYATTAFRLSGGTFNNTSDAVFNASGTGGIVSAGGTNAFNNAGTFSKTGATAFTINTNVPFHNIGTVMIEEGTLQFSGSGSNSGDYEVDPGATLSLSSSITHNSSSLLSGAGTVTFTNGTHIFPVDAFYPTGVVNFSAGTITVNNTFSPAALGTIGATNTTVLTLNAPIDFPSLSLARTVNFNVDQTLQTLFCTASTAQIGGSGNLTITDSFTSTSCTFDGTGVTTLGVGCLSTLSAGSIKLSRTLNNAGVYQVGAARFELLNGTLNNLDAAEIHFGDNNGGITSLGGTNSFNNDGALHVNDTCTFGGGLFTNTGVLNVYAPTRLTFSNGDNLACVNSGIFNVDTGAALVLFSVTNHLAGSVVQGGGAFEPMSGIHVFEGQFLLTGLMTFGGEVTINNTFHPTGLVTIRNKLTINAPQVWDSLHMTISNGSELGGSGDVTILNTIMWRGIMKGTGRTILARSGAVLPNAGGKTLARTFENHGTFSFTAGDFSFNNGTFNNMSDGLFVAYDSGTTIQDTGGFNAFNNYGTFEIGYVLDMYVPLNNFGIVNIPVSELQMRRPYTQASGATVLSGGSFKAYDTFTLSGGVVSGNGNVLADVVQTGGVISPGNSPGSLSFYSLTQNAAGVLDFELGGLDPGNDFDIVIANDISLSGSLRLSFINGFSPQHGDAFTVLTGVTLTGTFSAVEVVGFPDCIVDLVYDRKAATVIAVIESTPPEAICQSIDVQLDSNGNVEITPEQVDDGSTDNCEIASLELSRSAFTCDDVGPNIVTLTVTDYAGNVSTCQATVTVMASGHYQGPTGGSWFTPQTGVARVCPMKRPML